MKIYLAGPMTGIPYFNFPAFNDAASMLRDQGHEVFNPAEADNARHGTDISRDNFKGDPGIAIAKYGFSLREALAEDFAYLCEEAEAIALLPGWEASSGARAEWAVANALKLRFIYL